MISTGLLPVLITTFLASAVEATEMVTLDISHRPLGAVWTCRHLESRLMPNTDYRWYGDAIVHSHKKSFSFCVSCHKRCTTELGNFSTC